MTTTSRDPETTTPRQGLEAIHRIPVAVLAATALVLVGTMVYLHATATRLEETHTAWVDTVNELQLRTTEGHLWLEEVLGGDEGEDFKTALEHYHSALEYGRLLLEGGAGAFGRVRPVDTPELREQAEELLPLLEELIQYTHLRFESTSPAGPGSALDKLYDRDFGALMERSGQLHRDMETLVNRERAHFRAVQRGAIALCSGILLFLGILYHRFERQRAASGEALLLAAEETQRSEERYRSLVENIQLGITLIDTDYRVVATNRAQAALFQREPGEFIGRQCHREFEDRGEVCPHCPGRRAMGSGTAQTVDTEGVRQDGSTFPVRIQAFPVMDAKGAPTGFIEVVEDISASRRMEEDLRLKDFAVENATDMAMWTDASGRFVYVNQAACAGLAYSREELLQMSVSDIDPQIPPEKWPGVWTAIRDQGSVVLESEARRGDDGIIPVEIRASFIEFGDREYNCAQLQDLSDRKRQEEERHKIDERLQHLQKMESLEILAGGIAHDFNNILMGVLGNAELALDKLPPESPARGSVERIEASAKSAADLASQMLAYSGRGKFQVQPVQLNRLVEQTSHLLESAVTKKCVVKYDLAENLPAVEADITQLRQVLLNLVTNASEAIGDRSGVITVSTGMMEADHAYLAETYLDEGLPEGYYVYAEVSDTGTGMDTETRERVFDPFFSTKFTGRGLGLAAVLGIIRGHNGAVKVYSEPGRGTTFKVLFPCRDRALEPECLTDALPEGTTIAANVGGLVLVVDDEEPVRTVAKLGLEQAEFQVLTAEDGRQGLAVFRDHADEIAVVVLDMTMPHMSGEEVFRGIRRIRDDVPILLSSGYNEQEATGRFAGKGLAGFLHKPYRPSQLIREVRRIIAAGIEN